MYRYLKFTSDFMERSVWSFGCVIYKIEKKTSKLIIGIAMTYEYSSSSDMLNELNYLWNWEKKISLVKKLFLAWRTLELNNFSSSALCKKNEDLNLKRKIIFHICKWVGGVDVGVYVEFFTVFSQLHGMREKENEVGKLPTIFKPNNS